ENKNALPLLRFSGKRLTTISHENIELLRVCKSLCKRRATISEFVKPGYWSVVDLMRPCICTSAGSLTVMDASLPVLASQKTPVTELISSVTGVDCAEKTSQILDSSNSIKDSTS